MRRRITEGVWGEEETPVYIALGVGVATVACVDEQCRLEERVE